jgi:hypothetical protein
MESCLPRVGPICRCAWRYTGTVVLREKAFTEVVCSCLQLYKEISLQVSHLKFQVEVSYIKTLLRLRTHRWSHSTTVCVWRDCKIPCAVRVLARSYIFLDFSSVDRRTPGRKPKTGHDAHCSRGGLKPPRFLCRSQRLLAYAVKPPGSNRRLNMTTFAPFPPTKKKISFRSSCDRPSRHRVFLVYCR